MGVQKFGQMDLTDLLDERHLFFISLLLKVLFYFCSE